MSNIYRQTHKTKTGRESYDVERDAGVCKDCTPCKYGYYHWMHTKASPSRIIPISKPSILTERACDGYGMYDSDGLTDCLRCDTCQPGKYAIDVGNCTGNGIWKAPFKCAECVPCQSGYQHQQLCDGTTFNDRCMLCPSCPQGKYISSHWNSTTSRMVCGCTACRVGSCQLHQYRTNITCSGNATFDEGCANCTTCNSGEFISSGMDIVLVGLLLLFWSGILTQNPGHTGVLCSGLGFVDTTSGTCRTCREACPVGYYLNTTGVACLSGLDLKVCFLS